MAETIEIKGAKREPRVNLGVRCAPALHKRLVAHAAEKGVSVNVLCLSLLEHGCAVLEGETLDTA